MRALLGELQNRTNEKLLSVGPVRVRVTEDPGSCPGCEGPMKVQKTRPRQVVTLELGEAHVNETVHVCAARCRHPSGELVVRTSGAVTHRVPPGEKYGYDVLVHVGLRRFRDHRQREEIQQELASDHGIEVSAGTISALEGRFTTYLARLHQDRALALRTVLEADGGYPLHLDATGENGRGTVLVALAGWRDWVLGAWRIPTEREDQILPHLRSIANLFGPPVAFMRDLGRAMIPATQALVAELGGDIPILGCHQHFLADVGKGLLEKAYGKLRGLLRRSRLRPRLRALARDLGRRLGGELASLREAVETSLETSPKSLPAGEAALATVRALAQWVLDFARESSNLGFPYDRPYLDLLGRARTARRAVDRLLQRGVLDAEVERNLHRLGRALDPVVSERAFGEVTKQLEIRAVLFDRLRAVLRLGHEAGEEDAGVSITPDQKEVEIHRIQQDLETFCEQLDEEYPTRGPAEDRRKAIQIILEHLDRHGDSLWGHAISLPEHAGGGVRLVDRTNNCLEGKFRGQKQGERRRSGRKNLTADLEHLPAEAQLVDNLGHADYVEIVCGSLDQLPATFARLDAERQQAGYERSSGTAEPAAIAPLPITSASLPKEDRGLVRSHTLEAYIINAAQSRAPRVTIPRR